MKINRRMDFTFCLQQSALPEVCPRIQRRCFSRGLVQQPHLHFYRCHAFMFLGSDHFCVLTEFVIYDANQLIIKFDDKFVRPLRGRGGGRSLECSGPC